MSIYERWLIARGNVFSPSSVAVAKLVQKLREEKWVLAPGAPELAQLDLRGPRDERAKTTGAYTVRTVENTFDDDEAAKIRASTEALPAEPDKEWLDDERREELRIVWPVRAGGASPVKFPLSIAPEGGVDFALEIHRASDFVVPDAKNIPIVDCTCNCKEDLSFEWDPDEVVPAFESSSGIFTECEECSRTFDPSKRMAKYVEPIGRAAEELPGGAAYRFALKVTTPAVPTDARVAFAPELVALLEKEFGRSFYQVATVR